MKLFTKSLIVIGALLFTTNAMAESLEQILQDQTTTEISPVSFEGRSIRPGRYAAAEVCAAIGASRLVSFTDEPCPEGTPMGTFGTHDVIPGVVVFSGAMRDCSNLMNRLASVVCAK